MEGELAKLFIEPDKIRLDQVPVGFFNRVQSLVEGKNAEIERLRERVSQLCKQDAQKHMDLAELNKSSPTRGDTGEQKDE